RPFLPEWGVHKLLLEVIDQNTQAIKSYERSGFQTIRKLLCYTGTVGITPVNPQVTISKLETYDWERMQSFWDIHPTWQNSMRVVDDLKHLHVSLGAYWEGQWVGYLIFNPHSKRIHQIAVGHDVRRKGIASAMLSKVVETEEDSFSVINIDYRSENVPPFLERQGLTLRLAQWEMELLLAENHS
ncbi:MAG: GNAT family N-acetyltransferase, partial [Bacteroidota bacterium]